MSKKQYIDSCRMCVYSLIGMIVILIIHFILSIIIMAEQTDYL